MSLTILIGLVFLAAGLTVLLRPGLVAARIDTANAEAAAYALRIGGMMVATFGLVLLVFTIVYRTAQ